MLKESTHMNHTMENITLFDGESNTTYDMLLSAEDVSRASTDISFATALLRSAKRERDKKEEQRKEIGKQVDGQQTEESAEREKEDDLESIYRWSPNSVTLLLRIYKDKFKEGKIPNKEAWEVVSNELRRKGFKVSGIQCASKLRSLKKTYKGIKDHNNTSGNDRRSWQYLELMDEIFAKTAWTNPVAVASSSGISTKRVNTEEDKENASSSTPKNLATLFKRRLQQKEEHEQNKRKRHEDRMAMDSRLLAVLEKLADK